MYPHASPYRYGFGVVTCAAKFCPEGVHVVAIGYGSRRVHQSPRAPDPVVKGEARGVAGGKLISSKLPL